MRSNIRFLLAACMLVSGSLAFGVSAGKWVYDGEFATTFTAGANTPMFIDINGQGELAYGHYSGLATSELWVAGNIFAAKDGTSTIPVTQVNVPVGLTFEASTRGISGVAFQPGTNDLYIGGDGGGTNRQIQGFTRTGSLAYTPGSVVNVAANQGRLHGLAFSPVTPSSLLAGELVSARRFHVYNVASVSSITWISSATVPLLGAGTFIRDLAVDSSDTVYLNSNGTLLKMPGSGLNSVGNIASYTTATLIYNGGADNNLNGCGITYTNATDETAVIGLGGNNPSAQPRLEHVFNAATNAPIPQFTDNFLSEKVKATGSPKGDFNVATDTTADAKVAVSGGVPYLFISDNALGRIVRFKAVNNAAVDDWTMY